MVGHFKFDKFELTWIREKSTEIADIPEDTCVFDH